MEHFSLHPHYTLTTPVLTLNMLSNHYTGKKVNRPTPTPTRKELTKIAQ